MSLKLPVPAMLPAVPGLLVPAALVPVKCPWPTLPAELGGAPVEEAARDDPRGVPTEASPEVGEGGCCNLRRGDDPRDDSGDREGGPSGGLGARGSVTFGSGEQLPGNLGGLCRGWRPELPRSGKAGCKKSGFTSPSS